MESDGKHEPEANNTHHQNSDGRPKNWPEIEGFGPILGLNTFLGGITFAGMIVIMQARSAFENQLVSSIGISFPDVLIAATGGVSSLFILAAFVSTTIASGGENSKKQRDLAIHLTTASTFGILVLFPLLIVTFTQIGAMIIAIVESLVVIRMLTIPSPKKDSEVPSRNV
jgi:hypothetical protein